MNTRNSILAIATMLLSLSCGLARAQEWDLDFDASGSFLSETTENAGAPQIVSQPQQQVVGAGELASFMVVVADARGVSYQWRFNGTNLMTVTNDTLLILNVGATNEGLYSVVVANGFNSVTSSPAMLWFDGNGNGLPDTWELAYFGNLNQTATGDFDGDGVSNLQEFLDGTSPTNRASADYRLSVLSDGGSVNIVPDQSSYTNGQTVTITALPASAFHVWTGDVVSQSNSIVLTMTTNKTVFARFTPVDYVWANVAGGDWNTASNWSLNFVPETNDNAIITNAVTVTVSSNIDCASLTLNNVGNLPIVSGAGTLTLHAASLWASGTMSGSGRTVIAPGATLTIANSSTFFLTTRVLENDGTILWTGGGAFGLNGAYITNGAGALFDIKNSGSFSYQGGAVCRFDNAGTFRKELNPGTTIVGGSIPFNNYGTVDLQSGTLQFGDSFLNSGTISLAAGTTNQFAKGGSASGSFSVPAGAMVDWNNGAFVAFTLNPGAQLNGSGNYRITSGSLTCNTDLSVQNLDLVGTLTGTGAMTVNNVMNWTGGTMSGTGRTVIAGGAILNLNNPGTVFLTTRTLENAGTAIWTGAGSLAMSGGIITNRAGALFDVQNAGTFGYNGGTTEFDNAGTLRNELNSGATTFGGGGVSLNNYGTLDIRTGTVTANGGYTCTGSSTLSCALGGTAAGTSYGQLQTGHAVTLSGALSVSLTNGYVPSTNDSFTVMATGGRTGSFASFSYPLSQVTMQLSNTITSVIVRVTGVPPPQPVLLLPVPAGSNMLISWTAVSNLTYRLEFNPDLAPSNWNAVPGDVLAASHTASKLDTLTPSNRFYRVQVLP